MVERRDRRLAEPFRHGGEAGVGEVESEVRVGVGQCDAAMPVLIGELEGFELARS